MSRPWVVGVSGGADSMALLDSCQRAGISVIAAHFNHHLRPEADRDAEAVGELARKMGLEFVLGEGDVRGAAQAQGQSLEEAGREARYRFLFAVAQRRDAAAVAVAHHANDQVETVLMHLLRGAGSAGLRGMRSYQLPNPWSAEIPLVRPFLEVWKADLVEYCRRRGLPVLEDASNRDVTFFRNRLRHDLLPLLKQYSPQITDRLWYMSRVLAAEDDFLEEMCAAAWDNALLERGEGFRAFSVARWREQPLALQRRMVRRAMAEIRPQERNVDFHAVKRALDVAAGEMTASEVTSGVRAFLEGERFYLAAWEADLPTAQWPQLPAGVPALALPLPGEVALGDGWWMRAQIPSSVEHAREQALKNADPYRAWVDLGEELPSELTVRFRQAGERFAPLGMEQGTVKISDFMINVKLPRRARARWPLVCLGERIVWLPGYRLAHPFRLRPATRRIVFLSLEKK